MKKTAGILFCMFLSLSASFNDLSSAQVGGAVSGHPIKVDGSVADWVGIPPSKLDTWTISKGEFIWKDAAGDDTGNGHYTYPTDKAFGKGAADLLEFRITWDTQNVYFLIRTVQPGDWWVPYRLIAIDRDGAYSGKKGTQVITQGDISTKNADTGTLGELRVSPNLACEYIIGISGTYKGRIWDANGRLVAKTVGEKKTDTKGFLIKDANWSTIEVAVPQSIIGNPSGKTWRFIVATGLEEEGHLREIYKVADEWRGGGGENSTADDGVDPDLYDLASPDQKTQGAELGSYDPAAPAGDTNGFAVIKKSYLSVTFGAMRLVEAKRVPVVN